METRALKNPYRDYDGNPASAQALFDSQGKLSPDFSQRVREKVLKLLEVMEDGLKSADPRDCTTYTGWNGIALLYLHLHAALGDASYLTRALDAVCRSLCRLTRRREVTFLCGDAGPLAVAAVAYHRGQRAAEADDCLNRLLQLHPAVVVPSGSLPDELLFGRVGYLYALVFVNQQMGQNRVPLSFIQQITESILASGANRSKSFGIEKQSPLMYACYQEHYIGAAHGLAGIYYYLMQPGFVAGEERVRALVRPSVDYVSNLQAPGGNYPTCLGDEDQPLVHWCHGAPGVVYMLLQAYKAFGEGRYLGDALRCGEVVWRWGLLEKGYGLCHGAAGNAYTFLALYRMTLDPKHLYRACMFADWCMSYGEHGCRIPDTPFSLFEGMAGTIYFLVDLLQPMKSKFPAFEV